MHTAKSIVPAVQDLASDWVRHAAEGTSSQTDAVIRWALGRIDHADVPSVVHGVVLTLTGNRKTARKARRSAAKAVVRATKALDRGSRQFAASQLAAGRLAADKFAATRVAPRQGSPARAFWMALAAAGGLVLGAVLAWRMMVPAGEPAPVSRQEKPDHPDRSGEGAA
ncbi:hypothetical protein AAHB33_17045 [Paenarthrobacter sp. S56]|uniref:hypothetical protein n=1 Tax=Paenarthrobacter sp. S56 TaxID=3138179 RepID=UPI00321C1967